MAGVFREALALVVLGMGVENYIAVVLDPGVVYGAGTGGSSG